MHVTAEVVGGDTATLDLAEEATYGDLCRALGFSPHEVAVLVDDRPVPEDRTVEAERVRVLELISGG